MDSSDARRVAPPAALPGAERARAAIASLLDREDVLILDTETTGLRDAEVIEVALIDTCGEVRFESLVAPRVKRMNPYAQRVHGISLTMLESAPSWPEVFPAIAELAERRTILAWNAPFDARMVHQTSARWSIEQPSWLFVCAMRLYAKRRGWRARGLHKALADEKLTHLLERYPSHRALADARFTLEVLRSSSTDR